MPRTGSPISLWWLLASVWIPAGVATWAYWLNAPGWVLAVSALSIPCIATIALARRATLLREGEDRLDKIHRQMQSSLGEADSNPGEPTRQETIEYFAGEIAALAREMGGRLEHLSDRTEVLRLVLDASEDPMLATDAAGIVILANRAAGEFYGSAAAQLEGRNVEDFFLQPELLDLHASAASGRVRQSELRIPINGTRRTLQVRATPIEVDPTQPRAEGESRNKRFGVCFTMHDVTEFSAAVQLKTDYVANASHEFRTPLSSIKAAVETLADGAKDDAAMRDRLLSMIGTNVIRLEDLTADLLALSRVETGDAAVNVKDVFCEEIEESLLGMFEPVCAERKLTIRFEIDPDVKRLRTDPKLFALILKNLIDNATKFAYEGTTIRVVGKSLPRSGTPAALGRTSRWQVIDQGMGIPIHQQQRVFERFYQIDASRSGLATRRGTGLGLAIVKHAVKSLDGTIGVESVWKSGTTMIVDLPNSVVE